MTTTSPGHTPLSGFKVIDFTHVMAGPFCTHTLHLLGAEVIKIEPLDGGDVMRHYDQREEFNNLAPPFCAINAGKQSLALNLKSEAGKEIVRKLIHQADVIVENFRPDVLARLGFSYAACRELSPGIVYCSISGFGQSGPLKNNPAYDHIVQAMSGVMSLTGEPGSKHTKVGFPVLDTFAGYTAAMAIVSALLQRERAQRERAQPEQGEEKTGQYIDVAMLDASLNLMISMVAPYFIAGDIPQKVGNRGFNMSPTSDTFNAKDSEISIGANTQSQYEAMCKVLGREDLINDVRFGEREQRIANEEKLREEIELTTNTRHASEWEDLFNAAGVPSAAIRSIDDIAEHPHLSTRQLKRSFQFPNSGEEKYTLNPGFILDSMQTDQALSPPPTLGEHSRSILKSLDYSDAHIDDLLSEQIIATGDK